LPGFDRVADVYDATRSLRPDVMKRVVDGIVDFVGKSSVIDVGVGTGRFAAPLVRKGLDVTGLDVSPPMITQARGKGVPGLVLSAAESIPFREESFDYAMVVHFMHLPKEWRAALREVHRVTRRGLITVVGDPLGSRPRDTYVRLREERGFRMPGLRWGEREMVEMVPPSLTRELAEYVEEFDPDPWLEEYSAKLHSITWDIPDDVNAQIVEEMRSKLGGKRDVRRRLILSVWDRAQLREFYPEP